MMRFNGGNARQLGSGGLAAAVLITLIAGCGGQPSGGGSGADSVQSAAPSGGGPAGEGPAGGGQYGGGPAGTPTETSGGARRERPAGPREETLAAGTAFEGSLQQTIATDKNQVGDRIEVSTTEPVQLDGRVVVATGATIRGEVTHIEGAGRVAGGAELTLRFQELVLTDGTSYPITCEPFRVKGKSAGKESALEIGGGAVAGGVVGGLLGGKKDIVKGAAVGAVLGTGVAVATKGKQIVLPAGQKLRVTLTAPVTVPVKRVRS